jgi:DNA-binding CsgD family transcriptional regulator
VVGYSDAAAALAVAAVAPGRTPLRHRREPVVPAEAERGPAGLLGRRSECEALDRLVADVLAGESRVAVLRGEAGVGKSALLGYLSDGVADWRVARSVGVQSEMELAYSGLHQLCAPMLDQLERLPEPQRDALETVFGRNAGPAPDRFLVGLATLTLLAEIAEEQPLACIVDDAQWLDRASAQILGFVARRLFAERIAIVCAARTGIGDDVLVGLPELTVGGLGDGDARALLLRRMHGPLDSAVSDQIVAESHGNPLALLELPRTWRTGDLAGGFGLLDSRPVAGKIERSYAKRLLRLPPETQLLVLAAAAEPVGDPALLHGAVETLGIDMTAADAAEDAGLLHVHVRVEFSHPLVRSAAYRTAAAEDRHRVHRALAEATDHEKDPDRRAWHLAAATAGPDEQVASELERSAARAQTRGGIAAAAAFLHRAAALTGDPARRADRALAAAEASLGAGAFDRARVLLATAEAGPLDKLGRARVDLLQAEVAFAESRGRDAPLLLLQAARKLETLDVRLARDTYLDAWAAALFAGRLASAGSGLLDVSRAVATAPEAEHPLPRDLLLDGLALFFTEGRRAATPVLRHAVAAFASTEVSAEEMLRGGWLATRAANIVWDYDSCLEIGARLVELARDSGALPALAAAGNGCGQAYALGGDFASAALLAAELDAIREATGSRVARFAAIALAGVRGREDEASHLIGGTIEVATAGGQGTAVQYAHWANSILMNGLGRYEEALAAAVEASEDTPELFIASWALSELVEAATRTENAELAQGAVARLGEHTEACDSDWALGIHARACALTAEGDAAEPLYQEAIGRLGRTGLRPDLARSHLLYGEWLRRQGRRLDAREQLRAAHDLLGAIGMEAFAERARRELTATGETVRKRADETRDQLTPQEEQIARLARDGLSNPEIGAQLFLSPRTVEWHLRKVFAKLGISSRRELRIVLSDAGRHAARA